MGAQRRVNDSGLWRFTQLASAAAPFLKHRREATLQIVRSTPQAPRLRRRLRLSTLRPTVDRQLLLGLLISSRAGAV